MGPTSLFLLQLLLNVLSVSSAVLTFNNRLFDSDLYYAAESRNYPSDPDTLFVTCRNGGMKIFDLAQGQFTSLARWNTTAAVEGQDRLNDWLVVTELGMGPNGKFPNSDGPKLHLFDVSSIKQDMVPSASIELSQYIDAILHVKFVERNDNEVWVVCTGGMLNLFLNDVDCFSSSIFIINSKLCDVLFVIRFCNYYGGCCCVSKLDRCAG